MGSLPNLHELGKPEGEEQGYKPGPALGRLCGGCNDTLSSAEKSKILHRYSGHNKNKTRGTPHEHNKTVYDDVTVEHMTAYSPISSRSRYNLNQSVIRRRDSMTSSIGATSVRRLLAVVRGGQHSGQTGRGGGTVYTKRILIANLIVTCFSHLLYSAAYLPFVALQSSVSVWNQPRHNISIDIKIGSWLVSIAYVVAAIFTIIAPCVVRRFSANVVIALCYGIMIFFYLVHLYPTLYVTIPAFLILGVVQGLLSCAHMSFLMVLSHRITGLFHEEDEENRQARRTCVIRRVARAFQGAHDFGLILGSVISALLITYTVNQKSDEYSYNNNTMITDGCYSNSTSREIHCQNSTQVVLISSSTSYDYNNFLDDIFDLSKDDIRLCGMQSCPVSVTELNQTLDETGFRILPIKTADILIGVYAGVCGAALVLGTLGMDKIKMSFYQDSVEKGDTLAAFRAIKESFRDTRLQMAAPLALFIGIEQAFMFADFSKSYVVCTLGIRRLNLVFLSMGLLQSIAACTLSMLLRSIRRYYAVGVGFAFHGCLLMVLIVWKPTEDDPALFYVISASWGVCNAIWEMLNFTFLTGQYADNWESAFAVSCFFKFCGYSITFIFHGLLCNYIKLYALVFFMVIAVISFAWLEVRLEHIRKIKNITRL